MRWSVVIALTCVCCGGFAGDEPCAVDTGQLVITELGVRGQSYVELYSYVDVDLATLSLSVAGSGAPRAAPLSGAMTPGQYLAQPVRTLANAGGYLKLTCGSTVIDTVSYLAVKSDVIAFDGDEVPDADANDDLSLWCAQDGTPGEPNEPCNRVVIEPGDVLISEVLRSPVGPNSGHQWIELYAVADAEIDGLVVTEVGSSTRRWTVVASETVPAGTFVVLPVGGVADPRLKGSADLYASTATMSLLAGDVVIDSVVIDCGKNGTSCGRAGMGVDDPLCVINPPSPGEENTCE